MARVRAVRATKPTEYDRRKQPPMSMEDHRVLTEYPHDILLRVSRGVPLSQLVMDKRGNLQEVLWIPSPAERLDAAKSAAPYFAPKLAAVAHTGHDGGPIQVADMSDTEAARRLAFILFQGLEESAAPALPAHPTETEDE